MTPLTIAVAAVRAGAHPYVHGAVARLGLPGTSRSLSRSSAPCACGTRSAGARPPGRWSSGPGSGVMACAAADIPAGSSAEVTVACSLDPLAVWNPRTRQLDLPAGTTIVLEVGACAHDPAAAHLEVAL